MNVFNLGETDSEGRQKRVEHRGRYLRASRTGGVSLRAQTRVAGVNATANTSQGVRVSTKLAKNTQVALQNGRFVLRGRYGPDAAKINLSKSGVTVSTKTPVGAINWLKPGRSSFKMAGIQLRGQKAAVLQGIYGLLVAAVALLRFALWAVTAVVAFAITGVQWFVACRRLVAEKEDRPGFTLAEVAEAGAERLEDHGVDPVSEPARDLLAALTYAVVVLGRGETQFDPAAAGMADPKHTAALALATDIRVTGEQVAALLPAPYGEAYPKALVGVAHALAAAYADKVGVEFLGETLLALDDACLAGGPRTVLQEEMIDMLAAAFGVDLVMGEGS